MPSIQFQISCDFLRVDLQIELCVLADTRNVPCEFLKAALQISNKKKVALYSLD